MLRKEIGLRIKNIRLNMNMTKQKMADLLGISGQYLGMIERGEGTLSVDKLKILCDMTGLSADYILSSDSTLIYPFAFSIIVFASESPIPILFSELFFDL